MKLRLAFNPHHSASTWCYWSQRERDYFHSLGWNSCYGGPMAYLRRSLALCRRKA